MPKENDDEQTRAIERGQEGSADGEDEDRHVLLVGERHDRVFTEKSAERWTTHQGESPDQKCHKRDSEIAAQAAHFPNVLLVMKGDDDRTGREKEQRLEKSVRE